MFSEVTLFEYNVSTSLSPIVVPFSVTVVINIVRIEYLTHVFFSFFLSPPYYFFYQGVELVPCILSRCWAAYYFLSLFVCVNEFVKLSHNRSSSSSSSSRN